MMADMPHCRLAGQGKAGKMKPLMVRFTLFGVSVHIHLSFWVAALLWGLAMTGCKPHPLCAVLFGVAAFVVLLAHEFGHAVVGKKLLGVPLEVCLSFMGSRCYTKEERECTRARDVLTLLSGPLAGLVMLLAIWLGLRAATPGFAEAAELGWRMMQGELPLEYAAGFPPLLMLLLVYIIQLCACWTLLNLLPIYPLDGGLMLSVLVDTDTATHGVSLVATMLLALLFFATGVWALSLLMAILAYYNYRCIFLHSE